MANKIQLRRDTSANWTIANPILSLGEVGIETDTRKAKIGDGVTNWNSLLYGFGGTGGGDMFKSDNLAGLADLATARSNLGLGSLATQSGTFSGSSSGTNTGDNAANTTYASDYRAANFIAGTNYQAPIGRITGLAKGNGDNTLTSATVRTDYAEPTTALATGILKNTTTTGAHTIATGADLPVMSSTVGGAVPTPPNDASKFLNGQGSFTVPAGGGDMVLASPQTNSGLKTFLDATFGLRNVANTITSLFTNTATVARTWTLPDKNGTVAMTSDITGTNSNTNTGDVTLAGTPSYITIAGQVITRALIDLTTHVTGLLPFANIASVATGTVMYRKTAATGAMEAQTLATLKTDLGLTGTNSGDNATNTTYTTLATTLSTANTWSAVQTFLTGMMGLRNVANTFTSFFSNTATASRTYTLPDSNTTVPIISQQLTFSGPTAARTITLPDANFTVARTDAANTFTGVQTMTNPVIAKPVMNATNPTAQTYSPGVGGTATLDLSLSNQHDIQMPAGNATVALSNDTNNQIFLVSITQDATGSRAVTWFTTIKWAGGSAPTLTTTASKRDIFGFKRTGSGTYDGFVVAQNI